MHNILELNPAPTSPKPICAHLTHVSPSGFNWTTHYPVTVYSPLTSLSVVFALLLTQPGNANYYSSNIFSAVNISDG